MSRFRFSNRLRPASSQGCSIHETKRHSSGGMQVTPYFAFSEMTSFCWFSVLVPKLTTRNKQNTCFQDAPVCFRHKGLVPDPKLVWASHPHFLQVSREFAFCADLQSIEPRLPGFQSRGVQGCVPQKSFLTQGFLPFSAPARSKISVRILFIPTLLLQL